MGTKRTLSTIAGWIFLGLGTILSLPWAPVALLTWLRGAPLRLVVLAAVGVGVPLIAGVAFLRGARTWLSGREGVLTGLYLALGGLWVLASPLSVLNFLYTQLLLPNGSHQPLALAVIGVFPALLGLIYLNQAVAIRPAGRARIRLLAGWTYLALAALEAILGLVALVRGDVILMLSWLTQAGLVVAMGAPQLERRPQAMGAFFVSFGLLVGVFFLPGLKVGAISTFVLNQARGTEPWKVPNATLPTVQTIALLAIAAMVLGVWQALREVRLLRNILGAMLGAGTVLALVLLAIRHGLSSAILLLLILGLTLGVSAWQILRTRETNGILGAILFLFILAFLIRSCAGKEFNFTGMLGSMLGAATPIALGALSGVWCERSAVINIGIEGMMLSSAFTAVVVGSATKSLLLGMLVGMLTGCALAAILAVLASRFKVNQIIAGTAINIFSMGMTSFMTARLLAERQDLNASAVFARIPVPVLARIPVIGPVFFQNNICIYLMLALVVVTHIVLFYTRWGLRSRSVGEHPLAADTLGVNVFRTRYINVMIGGLIAGLGGAYFTLGSVGRFDEVMTAGRGFIGLAAMIFGRWTPVGAFSSSLIFGFADALQTKLSILQVPIPSHFLLMAPYLATIIVLAGVVGRAVAPKADGEVYEKH